METQDLTKKDATNPPDAEKSEGESLVIQKEDQGEPLEEIKTLDINADNPKLDDDKTQDELVEKADENKDSVSKVEEEKSGDDKTNDHGMNLEANSQEEILDNNGEKDNLEQRIDESKETIGEEKEQEPVFDGTEVPGMEDIRSTSTRSLDLDLETQKVVEKAVALKNLVKEKGEKGAVAVSNFLRRLSGKKDEEDGQDVSENVGTDVSDNAAEEASQKTSEKSAWNPLSYLTIPRDVVENIEEKEVVTKEPAAHIVMKGRIILYTRLGCKDCKEARLFLHRKRLKYVEINIDVYPTRKMELEKIAGSSAVPKVFFNEILIGGVSELKGLEESGKLDEKIDYLIAEAPSFEAPLPPLSGEDDMSTSGVIDELALIVRKMKDSIVVKDRFYKMRRFTSCFLGSEAVDFISEDQYLEREEVSWNFMFRLR